MESLYEGARSFLLSSGGDEGAASHSLRVIHTRVQQGDTEEVLTHLLGWRFAKMLKNVAQCRR
jgi:hypothetical protein